MPLDAAVSRGDVAAVQPADPREEVSLTILPTCPHPDYLKTPIPDITRLRPDDPLYQISSEAQAARLHDPSRTHDAEWWLESAWMSYERGDFQAAKAGATQALRLAIASGDSFHVGNAWRIQAAVQLMTGNFEIARMLLDQVESLRESAPGDRYDAVYFEAMGIHLLRTGYIATGEFHSAVDAFERAVAAYRSVGDTLGQLRSTAGLAGACSGIGQYFRALSTVDWGIALSTATGQWRYCGQLLTQAAFALADQGYPEGVAEIFNLAAQWDDFTGDRLDHIRAVYGKGRLWYFEMAVGASQEMEWRSAPLRQAMAEADEVGAVPLMISCHTFLSNICQKGGDDEGGMRHMQAIAELAGARSENGPLRSHTQHRLELDNLALNRANRMAARLHEGIENSPDPFFVFDAVLGPGGAPSDYVNEFRNSAANKLLGVQPTAVRMLSELSSSPIFDGLSSAIRATAADGTHFQDEIRLGAEDGSATWLLRRVAPSADGATVSFRDVSESLNLRILSRRIQLATRAGGVGVFEFDFSASAFIWDARMHELYGVDPEHFQATVSAWLAMVYPEDRARVALEWQTAVAETSVFESDFRIVRPDGALRYIRALAHVIRGATGSAARTVGTNWDITEHKSLTEELFEEKERLRITLHSIGDAVICTDAEAQVTFMNPVAEQMTGWTSEDSIGLPIQQVFRLVHEATGEPMRNPVDECLTQTRPVHFAEGAVLVSRDEVHRDIQDSAAPVRTTSGEIIGAVLIFQDVSTARALQRELLHTAMHDSLTGLPNRTAFERKLRDACSQASEEGRQHALCFIDLDRFKIVNDSAGHAAGDALLRDVGAVLRDSVRMEDFTARLGGDEFALLLQDCSLEHAEKIATYVVNAIGAIRFPWDGKLYDIGASIGMTAITANASRPTVVMGQADVACYAAKAAGRSRVSVYDGDESSARYHHREIQIASTIRSAIDANRFHLYAQELRDLNPHTKGPRKYEILLRMLDDSGQLLLPAAFIPAAERYDLMGRLDRWVVQTVLRTYGHRLRDGNHAALFVNLSANSLNDPAFLPFLLNELAESELPADRLNFEITETALINNLTSASQFVAKMRAIGCGIILDDFGTGVCSFTYLKQFPLDGIKIDGSFIRQLATSAIDRAIVESINDIGHRLGIYTTAECVEDAPTLAICRELGIDCAQGHAISLPVPLDTLF